MKKSYRVVEPIKYGHYPFGVGAKVEMDEELGEPLCDDGVLETWPETEAERAARLNAEITLQADLQKAEREKAERELAEAKAKERGAQDSNAASATPPQADGGAGDPAPLPADSNTPQQGGGSDDASPSEIRDSQDAQSETRDGTGAGAVDASAPKSTGGTKNKTGKK